MLFRPGLPGAPVSTSSDSTGMTADRPARREDPPVACRISRHRTHGTCIHHHRAVIFSVDNTMLTMILIVTLLFGFRIFNLNRIRAPTDRPGCNGTTPYTIGSDDNGTRCISGTSINVHIVGNASRNRFTGTINRTLTGHKFDIRGVSGCSDASIRHAAVCFNGGTVGRTCALVNGFASTAVVVATHRSRLVSIIVNTAFGSLRSAGSSPRSNGAVAGVRNYGTTSDVAGLPTSAGRSTCATRWNTCDFVFTGGHALAHVRHAIF